MAYPNALALVHSELSGAFQKWTSSIYDIADTRRAAMRFALSAMCLLSAGTATAQYSRTHPTGRVERKYFADGPSAVSRMTSSAPCDRRGHLCDVWYPSDIRSGKPRPVVAWANGTADAPVEPKVYDYLLTHLASWGFVVIATRDPKTGYGDTVLDSLDYLKAQAGAPASPIHRRVDLDRVGVAGHSQGATGAINAMLKSQGRIRTTVAFQLPSQHWCSPADRCVLTEDLRAAKSGSIFYVGGAFDVIISPDRQKGENTGNKRGHGSAGSTGLKMGQSC